MTEIHTRCALACCSQAGRCIYPKDCEVDATQAADRASRATGAVVALDRASENEIKRGWTLPVSTLEDVARKVTDAGWDAPTIEIIEIAMLEAERRMLAAAPQPEANAELVDAIFSAVSGSLSTAVSPNVVKNDIRAAIAKHGGRT